MNPENENYHVEGSPAESELTGIVSGEIESRGMTGEEQEAKMKKRLAIKKTGDRIIKTLGKLQEKYGHDEEIARVLEDASGITDPRERVGVVIDNFHRLADALEKRADIGSGSRMRRVYRILDKLDGFL